MTAWPAEMEHEAQRCSGAHCSLLWSRASVSIWADWMEPASHLNKKVSIFSPSKSGSRWTSRLFSLSSLLQLIMPGKIQAACCGDTSEDVHERARVHHPKGRQIPRKDSWVLLGSDPPPLQWCHWQRITRKSWQNCFSSAASKSKWTPWKYFKGAIEGGQSCSECSPAQPAPKRQWESRAGPVLQRVSI